MTNDEARHYFQDKGLTYKALTTYTIDLLISIIQNEIMKMRKEREDCILVRINNYKYSKKQLNSKQFNNVFLTVSGTYFSDREAISFNTDGFIGFAGWASTINTKPFINGFIKWCDDLADNVD
jgi:hypothetical protein